MKWQGVILAALRAVLLVVLTALADVGTDGAITAPVRAVLGGLSVPVAPPAHALSGSKLCNLLSIRLLAL